MAKPWTQEEITFLENSWGTKTLPMLSKQLNRSITAIKRKATRLQLGPWLTSGDYITLNQLWKTLGLGNGNFGRTISWIDKRNFPVKYKNCNRKNTRVVYIEDFWIWAKDNLDIVNLAGLEPLALGEEPDWVEDKRNQDKMKNLTVQNSNWTTYEDNKLIDMLKTYRYTTRQIASDLHRTEQAVIQRIKNLKLKYRPVPEDRHNKWTLEEEQLLMDNVRNLENYLELSKLLPNRSERAIKSKLYSLYGTQTLHKIK